MIKKSTKPEENQQMWSKKQRNLAKTMFCYFIDEWDEYVRDWYGQDDVSPESIKEAEKLLCIEFGLTKRELVEFKEKWE